jgi:hypothetical protein
LFTPNHPTRGGRPELGRLAQFIRPNTMNARLRKVLDKMPEIPANIGWRHATRTTFGSHHVMAGGTLEELRLLLGHEDQKTTQRYAKLRVDLFPTAAYSRVRVDFSQPDGGKVLPMPSGSPIGSELAEGPSVEDEDSAVSN